MEFSGSSVDGNILGVEHPENSLIVAKIAYGILYCACWAAYATVVGEGMACRLTVNS